MWLTSNSKYTTTIRERCKKKNKKKQGDNNTFSCVKEECPEVHIRACSCSLPNDRIESAKERKLAMLVQATVMINAKQSGIGERQRGMHQLAYYFL